jgi:hypothetical protein
MVTRPLIESIASITRPRRRSVVGSIPWLKQAKTTIISGMGGGSWWRDSDWGIHILHGMSPPYLITSFGEGIVIIELSLQRHFGEITSNMLFTGLFWPLKMA